MAWEHRTQAPLSKTCVCSSYPEIPTVSRTIGQDLPPTTETQPKAHSTGWRKSGGKSKTDKEVIWNKNPNATATTYPPTREREGENVNVPYLNCSDHAIGLKR